MQFAQVMDPDFIVEQFNQKFPVGTTVRWRIKAHPNYPLREYTVQHEAIVHNGKAVAWFIERTGMNSIEPGFIDYEGEENAEAGN